MGKSGKWWGRKVRQGGRVAINVAKTASAAYSLASGVAALVNSESKYYDTGIGGNVGTSAIIQCLNLIPQDTTETGRNGNSIRVSSLQLRAMFTAALTTPTNGVRIRLMLITEKFLQSATAPAITDILALQTMTSPLNLDSASLRFKILFDKVYTVDLDSRPVAYVRYYKKFVFGGKGRRFGRRRLVYKPSRIGGHFIRFDGTAGTIASTYFGNIYLVMFSDDNTNAPVYDYYARLRFYDN